MKKFNHIPALATRIRHLSQQSAILIYAFNGIGKTRLSMEFKNIGKQKGIVDTLYFNAYTEDLFTWDNDSINDKNNSLMLDLRSSFFNGVREIDLDAKVNDLMEKFCQIRCRIDPAKFEFKFSRIEIKNNIESDYGIKISRGEQSLFIWCVFLVIMQMAIDEAEGYEKINNIYIDDPITSLDENHTIEMVINIAKIITDNYSESSKNKKFNFIISTHHSFFYALLVTHLKDLKKTQFMITRDFENDFFLLHPIDHKPNFYHIAMIKEIKNAIDLGRIYPYHYNILRVILEKSSSFHGYPNFFDHLKSHWHDLEVVILYERLLNNFSHGTYSIYEGIEMVPDNKKTFIELFNKILDFYPFNKVLIN